MKQNQAHWWSEAPAGAWERLKEAVRRDWAQTKHDLALAGGHELNQTVGDTVRQVLGRESIPDHDRPNPPKVIGEWEAIERPLRFGYGARKHYGALYPEWSSELEALLARDWERSSNGLRQSWLEARKWVRQGYERTGGTADRKRS